MFFDRWRANTKHLYLLVFLKRSMGRHNLKHNRNSKLYIEWELWSKNKIFEKGFTLNWTEELFKIKHTNPPIPILWYQLSGTNPPIPTLRYQPSDTNPPIPTLRYQPSDTNPPIPTLHRRYKRRRDPRYVLRTSAPKNQARDIPHWRSVKETNMKQRHQRGACKEVGVYRHLLESTKWSLQWILLSDDVRRLIVGKSNCGKTTLLINLLLHSDWLCSNHLYVFGKRLHQQEYHILTKGYKAGLSKRKVANLFFNQNVLTGAVLLPVGVISGYTGVRDGHVKQTFKTIVQWYLILHSRMQRRRIYLSWIITSSESRIKLKPITQDAVITIVILFISHKCILDYHGMRYERMQTCVSCLHKTRRIYLCWPL